MIAIAGLSAMMYGKFCSGPDAEVHAPGLGDLNQIRNDDLIAALVREKVVGLELAVRLGGALGERPEFLIGEFRRQID